MANYMIETSHTKEECLKSLDEMMEYKPKNLDKFQWGCSSGVHTGWAMTDANDETEARNILPPSMRAKARVTKVDIFTPEQIKSYHEKKNA